MARSVQLSLGLPLAHTPFMLHAFIRDNRDELLARVRARVTKREVPRATQPELDLGVPLFLARLSSLLEETMTRDEEDVARGLMHAAAGAHGQDLLAAGLTVAQVVHDYGDICQIVTALAIEREVPISTEEFRAFNRCLDDAIAGAVTEYGRVRERSIVADGAERLGVLVHELRNVLSTAMLSFDTIKRGVAGTEGSLGAMHTRSLIRLRDLIDGSLTQVRLDAAIIKRERVVIAEVIEEAEIPASIQARSQGLRFSVAPVDIALRVDIDRQLLASALANLLQNAFKFTHAHSLVSLTTHATALRVSIDVEDECGGLPDGKAKEMFRPFAQLGVDRSGLGLGLTIARRAVEANGGELRVLDLPNVGCRFTIDLPRCAEAAALS